MNYLYVDASTLVSIALNDPARAPKALKHISKYDEVMTSDLSRVECQAGLSSQLSNHPDLLVAAEQNMNRVLNRLMVLNIATSVVDMARTLIRRHRVSIGLRSADAIHLASANEFRQAVGLTNDLHLEYLTSDRKQHQAFTAEGFEGLFLQ
ncbi:MAG TPA: type II toxin-antitoxin system VapC family toxin [Acidobacteriota bacterium]|jgi:predicted nucleic acid-binding protein